MNMTRQHPTPNGRQETTRGNGPNEFSDHDKEEARTSIKRAFELCGLADSHGYPLCPLCGKGGKSRVKFFADGGFKCFSAQNCSGPRKAGGKRGDAIDLVMERLGVSFPEAVGLLVGRPVTSRSKAAKPLPPPVVIEVESDNFKAVVDSEVYQYIADAGNPDKAAEYFARFHITADAVRTIGFFYVDNMPALHNGLLRTFGRERLIACGVLIPGEGDKKDFYTISDRYCVGEPHKRPDGKIVGLQFRPSYEQEKRYKAHRAYQLARKEAEANGTPFREPKFDEKYVPKFMSLKGGTGSDHLVGGNLERCGQLPPGSTVYFVEGLKDAAALLSRGFEAYALPGAGTVPPKEAVRLLARHHLVLAFDADEGGDGGSENLMKALAKHGVLTDDTLAQLDEEDVQVNDLLPEDAHAWAERTIMWRAERQLRCYRKRPPAGMDIADALADHIVTRGSSCGCPACVEHRQRSKAAARR